MIYDDLYTLNYTLSKKKVLLLIITTTKCIGILCKHCPIRKDCFDKYNNPWVADKRGIAIKEFSKLYGEETIFEELL